MTLFQSTHIPKIIYTILTTPYLVLTSSGNKERSPVSICFSEFDSLRPQQPFTSTRPICPPFTYKVASTPNSANRGLYCLPVTSR